MAGKHQPTQHTRALSFFAGFYSRVKWVVWRWRRCEEASVTQPLLSERSEELMRKNAAEFDLLSVFVVFKFRECDENKKKCVCEFLTEGEAVQGNETKTCRRVETENKTERPLFLPKRTAT